MTVERHKGTHVTFEPDGRQVIETDQRRASAILQVLAGASLQEVGDSFGVSRERIRQYLAQAGLTSAVRQRLYPNERQLERWFAPQMKRRARKNARKARLRDRLRRGVEIIRAYVQSHGAAPADHQLYRALTGHRGTVTAAFSQVDSWLGGSGRGHHLRLLYRMAQCQRRPQGIGGHLNRARTLRRRMRWLRSKAGQEHRKRMRRLATARHRRGQA